MDTYTRKILNDEEIDTERERARCASYNFDFPKNTAPKRRRLFLGALIADDSIEVLKAVGTEAYNIFHTVSFIESNVTTNLTPKKWRFLEDERPSQKLHLLYQLFGPKTKVRTHETFFAIARRCVCIYSGRVLTLFLHLPGVG